MEAQYKKLTICLLCGGRSGEHEISLLSAKSVYEALDKEKYTVLVVGIDKQGKWKFGDSVVYAFLNPFAPGNIALNPALPEVMMVREQDKLELKEILTDKSLGSIDAVLPILHGTYGEDGVIQGFLELLDVAYVGAGVVGSTVGMDKDVMKRLLRDAGINIAKFRTLKYQDFSDEELSQIIHELKFPIFVKPANLGSSVGVSKAKDGDSLKEAIKYAFEFDTKVILEECIDGRELEVGVLGTNTNPKTSIVGEIKPKHEFYSYESKYLDEHVAKITIPAQVPHEVGEKIREIASHVFTVLECYGMCRADFFYSTTGEIYLNEINTIPGFTKISMYPKLWEATGIPYSQLLDELIKLAVQRKERIDKLKRDFK